VIAIVDYRAGNLTSVKKAFDHIGTDAVVTADPDVVAKANKIVLPGVGHFAATCALSSAGLREAITEATQRKIPYLGICVGMQWMLESSEEAPSVKGLGVWPGACEHFPSEVKAPHVGWNQLEISGSSRLLKGIAPQAFVYFTHSYRVPVIADTVAASEYGGKFSAAVERDHLFGVQFHPEKSGPVGLKVLENFCEL
jgi:imidazole glycerol-phosphate synthase subunit HisH